MENLNSSLYVNRSQGLNVKYHGLNRIQGLNVKYQGLNVKYQDYIFVKEAVFIGLSCFNAVISIIYQESFLGNKIMKQ